MSSDDENRPAGRLARWWGSWRWALRIGRREALQHRGRSVLVMILIGVPVMIVTAGLAVFGTAQVRVDDWARANLGAAQAIVSPPLAEAGAIVQDQYGQYLGSTGPGRPRAGTDPEAPWRAEEVGALLSDARIATVDQGYLVAFGGSKPIPLRSLQITADSIADFGLAELIEGRWPAAPGELVVTDRAIQPGIPRSGPLTITVGGVETTASVVGVVRAPAGAEWQAVLPGPAKHSYESWFLVQGTGPVTWPDVQRLNEYGLLVQSRAVMEGAPPFVERVGSSHHGDASVLDLYGGSLGSEQATSQLIQVAAVSIGVLIEVTLLAGPAFALGAARQRRMLALIAACGADRRQVRRIVLGQSVLLGGAAAVAGTVLGLAVSPLLTHLLWWVGAITQYGSWRPPFPLIMAVMIAAVLAAVIAALGPARVAARRDVASTLTERWQPPPRRRGVPLVGGALLLLATGGMIFAATAGHEQPWAWPVVIIGCLALTLGGLMIIPAIVAGWGRVGHRWPLPIRLAARDVGRQHQRSVPAIAAVVAATAVLAGFGVLFASQTALAVKVHTPVTTPGQAVLSDYSNDEALRGSLERIQREFPDWTYVERDRMIQPPQDVGWATFYSTLEPVPTGCTEAEILDDVERCTAWDDPFASPLIQQIPAGDRALAPESAAALRAGKILITEPSLIIDGKVRLIEIEKDYQAGTAKVIRRVEVPAVLVDPGSLVGTLHHTRVRISEPYGWMLPGTADAHELPRRLDRVLFGPAGRDITAAEESRIRQLIEPDQPFTVERGHVDEQQPKLVPMLVGAGFLVLLAAVVATVLAQIDGRAEQSTLAAVGAAPTVRRGQAAAQALLLAATGMVFGAVLGLVPGLAIALLDQPPAVVAPGPQLALPWVPLGLLIITVPLIAAGLAALTSRSPVLSRRPT
ncbi:ABC transporter permease [Microlunatus speluncae]|uniref:ABC transporter permease n=1 Tax=Microlunatus speluncae TaxID=2594267 RepID=UPI00126672EF|nr:ABC transporter permease [Microlunatus speluncae]